MTMHCFWVRKELLPVFSPQYITVLRKPDGEGQGLIQGVPHTPTGMAILEPKNKGQNRQTMHLRFIYGSLRHVYNVKHGICTSSNKFLLGVIVKYCQFPRHKCFLLQNLLTKKLHNCGHFGQCTVLHIDYLYRQEGQK